MKIYLQTNKATTNIFFLHTQPRETTRYTNILKLVWGGGGVRKKSSHFKPFFCKKILIFRKKYKPEME